MICNCVHTASFSFGKLPPGLVCGTVAGISPDFNRYSYAWNNPLKYIYPSGYNNIRLDENTTAIPYIAGSSGYLNNWNYITSGIGPGSGNHWSDQYRSEWGNFMLGNQRSFDGMYGQGAYDLAREVYKNPDARTQWVTGQGSLQKGMWVSEWRTNTFTQSGSMGSSITYSDGPEAINRFMKFSGTSGRVNDASGGRSTALFIAGAASLGYDSWQNLAYDGYNYIPIKGSNAGKSTSVWKINKSGNFALRNGSKIPNSANAASKLMLTSMVKVGGIALTTVGVGFTVYDIRQNGINLSNGTDFIMGSVAYVPGWGWAVSGGYFIGKACYEVYPSIPDDYWGRPGTGFSR